MDAITNINWMYLAPEFIILSAAALLLLIDLVLKPQISRRYFGIFSLISLIWAGIYVGWLFDKKERLLGDTYLLDSFSATAKLLLLTAVAFVILITLAFRNQDFEAVEGEYYYLLLLATLGGMVIVSSADLITLFVGLELLSISSYILVGIRKTSESGPEAAWKYFVMGSVASAFILYGMSFLYGFTGSTNLFTIKSETLQISQSGYVLYIYLALFFIIFGFGFKIASAPFHTWAPDVYQGAYTSIASFLAVGSKIATFCFIFRFFIGEWHVILQPILLIVASASMIIGNTVALMQTNVKRLMAYSGISQMGYLLIPLAILGNLFMESTFYYLLAYLFMTMGAFAILFLVTEDAKSDEISAFAGLYHRSPWLAFLMSVFLISLAGFPITAGFLGKFYILMDTLHSSLQYRWLVAIMIITTIISYVYYFRLIRQMYLRKPVKTEAFPISWPVGLVVLISFIGTIGLAIMPNWTMEIFSQIKMFV